MHHVRLVHQLLAQKDERPTDARVGEVPAEVYRSGAAFERDRAVIARTPTPVAVVPEIGACVPIEVGAVSALVTRDADSVHVFKNACRHRSTELVSSPCEKRAIVCPYHGWTYSLAGKRIHVPHANSFGALTDRDQLVELPSALKYGLVWAALTPFDLDAHLAPVSEAFAALDGLSLYRTTTREVAGNWKLIIDAFLDG
jgi:glycine betaine catabolism A